MKTNLALLILLFYTGMISAQVGLDTTNPQATFHIVGEPGTATSADGIIIPALSLTDLDAKMSTGTYTAAQNGVMVYVNDISGGSSDASTENITAIGFYYYNDPTWFAAGENKFWSTTGNSGIDDTENFLGTTDEKNLIFKVNDTLAGFIGYDQTNPTPIEANLFLGFEAGNLTNPGKGNTFIGGQVGRNIEGVEYSTGVGYRALEELTTGTANTALGFAALANNTIGTDNTALGNVALSSNISGLRNSAVGDQSLENNTTGSNNAAIGFHTLKENTVGDDNTAAGHIALNQNINGNFNSAFGSNALRFNISGNNLTAFGDKALRQNTASNNTAVGSEALLFNETGTNLTAVGFRALSSNTEDNNTGVGTAALRLNTTGSDNSALGYNAAFGNTTGSNNTAIGKSALEENMTGSNNTAVGADAFNGTYSNSTAVGYNAQVNGNNSTAIGFGANADAANKIRLGNDAVTATDIAGQLSVNAQSAANKYSFPNNRGTANYALATNADGTTSWVDGSALPSDVNLKTNIQGLNGSLEKIMKLRGVSYNWKDKKRPDSEIGVIAQEVEEIYPELVIERENGYKAVRYISFTAILIEAVQEQQDIIEQQNQKLDEQDKDIEELKSMLAKQQEQIKLLMKKVE
jgi:hypothetical protein